MWNQVRDVEDACRRLVRARAELVDDERFDLERWVTSVWILQNAHREVELVLEDLLALIGESLTPEARAAASNGRGWQIGTFRVRLVDGAPVVVRPKARA